MNFELLLIRHGQAEDFADGGDSERALTEFGRETATIVGDALRAMDLSWSAVVSSPFRRAVETATLITGATDFPHDAMLTPGVPPDETIETLAAYATTRLLAVGHNPNITATLGELVVGDPGVYFSVAPGDVAHLWMDRSPKGWRAAVLGFYPAKMLRRLRAL